MAKITQHQAILYQLYKQRQADPEVFIPIWKLIGEVYIEELKQWVFIGYEVSARTSELFNTNPGLLDRKLVTGKTGAKYYAYRIHPNVTAETIRDPKLNAFRKRIKNLSAPAAIQRPA